MPEPGSSHAGVGRQQCRRLCRGPAAATVLSVAGARPGSCRVLACGRFHHLERGTRGGSCAPTPLAAPGALRPYLHHPAAPPGRPLCCHPSQSPPRRAAAPCSTLGPRLSPARSLCTPNSPPLPSIYRHQPACRLLLPLTLPTLRSRRARRHCPASPSSKGQGAGSGGSGSTALCPQGGSNCPRAQPEAATCFGDRQREWRQKSPGIPFSFLLLQHLFLWFQGHLIGSFLDKNVMP